MIYFHIFLKNGLFGNSENFGNIRLNDQTYNYMIHYNRFITIKNVLIAGVIVAHMSGQLYTQIFNKQAQFSTQMSVSGSAAGTGKSLMQTVCMLMFYGEVQPTTTTMTEATFYDLIEEGNIYGKGRGQNNRQISQVLHRKFYNTGLQHHIACLIQNV